MDVLIPLVLIAFSAIYITAILIMVFCIELDGIDKRRDELKRDRSPNP
jgi:hypothetical protein